MFDAARARVACPRHGNCVMHALCVLRHLPVVSLGWLCPARVRAAVKIVPAVLAACALLVLFDITAAAAAAPPVTADAGAHGEWRLRIREAAVTAGDTVTLGDIAEPFGPLTEQEWRALAQRPLWAAPPEAGKPLQISRVRLQQILRERLGDLADRCLLPPGLVIQRGGTVWYEADLRTLVVKTLTPVMNALPGRVDFTDFRLPAYIFLTHAGQRIDLEPVKAMPGRASLRFQVVEVDGSVARRFTGTTFINVWADVVCAAVPYNRGDTLTPEGLTMMHKNLAHLRGDLWDGRGGPWQATRALGAGQPILLSDIAPKAAIRRGEIITLVYERGNVRLSVQAEAMADGSLGDTITVRNLQSKKQIFGIIRDSATVVAK